jgi:hypothetical protein
MKSVSLTERLLPFLPEELKVKVTQLGMYDGLEGEGMSVSRYVGKVVKGPVDDQALKEYAQNLQSVFNSYKVTHLLAPPVSLELGDASVNILVTYFGIAQEDLPRFDASIKRISPEDAGMEGGGCRSCGSCKTPCSSKKDG